MILLIIGVHRYVRRCAPLRSTLPRLTVAILAVVVPIVVPRRRRRRANGIVARKQEQLPPINGG